MATKGILPDHMIAELAKSGGIRPAREFAPDQIQPASLDLRLGKVAYRVRASFLPGPQTTVAERIAELRLHEIALTDGAVLETNCVYIVPLLESLALPADVAAAANPKSSTGRIDVFTRVIADRTRGFDRINAGYHGPLYAEISPKTFPVLVREGSRLSQIRFRRGHAILDGAALRALHDKERLTDDAKADVARWHRGRRRSRRSRAEQFRRLSRQAPHRPDRRREARRSHRRRFLGADRGARRQEPDPRSRRILHPRVQGSGAGAAGLRRRDGAVRSAGRRVPRALRRLLRSRASATKAPAAAAPARCWRCARARCRSSWSTARSSAGWCTRR